MSLTSVSCMNKRPLHLLSADGGHWDPRCLRHGALHGDCDVPGHFVGQGEMPLSWSRGNYTARNRSLQSSLKARKRRNDGYKRRPENEGNLTLTVWWWCSTCTLFGPSVKVTGMCWGSNGEAEDVGPYGRTTTGSCFSSLRGAAALEEEARPESRPLSSWPE